MMQDRPDLAVPFELRPEWLNPIRQIEVNTPTSSYVETSTIATTTRTTPIAPRKLLKTCPKQLFKDDLPCWLYLGTSESPTCYCFSLTTSDWFGAHRKCHEKGMDLISLDKNSNLASDHLLILTEHVRLTVPELKNYLYWTSGRVNFSRIPWLEWTTSHRDEDIAKKGQQQIVGKKSSANGRNYYIDGFNTESSYDSEVFWNKFEGQCALFNKPGNTDPSYLATRLCASPGYRFICEMSVMRGPRQLRPTAVVDPIRPTQAWREFRALLF